MDLSLPDAPAIDSFSGSHSFYDSSNNHDVDSIATLEYLGKEPLTQEQAHLYPHMPIYPNETYTFGISNCSYNIPDPHRRVSKRHFRIYTVVYEKDKPEVQPLVYCEDFQSLNGTFVNGILIGKMYRDKIAYLLTDGDIIEIKPSWKFRFHQPNYNLLPIEESINVDAKVNIPTRLKIMAYKKQHFEDEFTISERVLGQGQYGTVYLAKEVVYATQVACKIIDLKAAAKQRGDDDPRKAHKPTMKQKLRKEIEIMAALSHPNIINLRKAFCSDNMIYIFTDLAPGGDLFSYIDAHNGHLEDLQGRMVAWQLMQAVNYMHDLGIVHRDIKTENVLIAQTDLGGRVILTDFGFANYEDRTTGRLMSKVGTPGFVAPEVNFREKWAPRGYTKAADLWSCGVLTAFMLTGEQIEVALDSSLKQQERDIIKFCNRMKKQTHIKPHSVDFVRSLVVPSPDDRWSAVHALSHKWFTDSIFEAAEQNQVYKRATKYWKKRDPEETIIEEIPPTFVIPPAREDVGPKRRKRLPDVTSSPYFNLERHLQTKVPSKRRQILEELKLEGSAFMIDPGPQSGSHRNQQSQFSGLEKAVDGRDIFAVPGAPRLPECQVETQDLTPSDANEVDLVPSTLSSTETRYTYRFNEFSERSQEGTARIPRILLPDIKNSSRRSSKTKLEDGTVVKELLEYPTAKKLRIGEKATRSNKEGDRWLQSISNDIQVLWG